MVFVHVQNLVSNIQNLVYLLTLPNVVYNEPIIPPVFVSLTENIMEQNPIGFANSMYPLVRPYTLYFGFSYEGVGGVPTM
jgi:hypothetical protein